MYDLKTADEGVALMSLDLPPPREGHNGVYVVDDHVANPCTDTYRS
jgi:hypothetical protein